MIDDVDMVAMDALERLYVTPRALEPLKDVYAKKADLAEDPADKKRMLYVLAQVYDRELGDVGKSIETYQAILDLDADELPAIQSLEPALWPGADRWYEPAREPRASGRARRDDRRDGRASSIASAICGMIRMATCRARIESYREALELRS